MQRPKVMFIVMVIAAGSAGCGASGRTVFVDNGDPKCIRPVGYRWAFNPDYVAFQNGPRSILFGGKEIGEGDFHLTARLAVTCPEVVPSFLARTNGIKGFHRFGHAATIVARHRHLPMPSDRITPGRPFEFEAIRKADKMTFKIDGQTFHEASVSGDPLGTVGFTASIKGAYPRGPDVPQLRIFEFSVVGKTRPIQGWPRTRPWRNTLPEIDISGEKERIVTIAAGTDTIGLSYPSTVLMPDGKTIFCVYEKYLSKPRWQPAGIKLKKSLDGGRTWSGLLPSHESWKTVRNCPTIHRLEDRDGKQRLLVMVPYGPKRGMHQSVSLDGGATWSPMQPNGLSCTVPPIRLVPISGKRYLALYHTEEGGGLIRSSVTEDGGLTWSKQKLAVRHPDAFPCEPFVIRSPDGKELTMIAREQSRIYNSMLATSRDEGRTWTDLREGPAGLTGDRHLGLYAPDGRIVVVFRDNSVNTPLAPPSKISNLVAWVGAYEDLVQGREGQYRIVLLQGGAAYPGLELLPDGTIVATCGMKDYTGVVPISVFSTRFKMEEIDARLAEQ